MDYTTISPYIAQGLVKEQRHPECSALAIFNYTPQCQYAGAWDEVTMACRGLILNTETGEIVARPFGKFFNLEEHTGTGLPLPAELPVVTEKLDGSLGILYWLNDEPWIATRGSFVSTQAQWATAWMRKALQGYARCSCDMLRSKDVTHIFEIVYRDNRIVVRYDWEGLAHLATVNRATGRDIYPMPFFPYMYYPKTLRLGDCDLTEIQARDEANAEGYVALFPESGFRLKAKFSTYVSLHKFITGLSEKGIWELLKTGADLTQYLDNVPDEWMDWFEETSARLLARFSSIWQRTDVDWHALESWSRALGYTKETHRKELAMEILRKPNPSLLFALLDGKTFDQQIWKMIEPKGQRTFREDADHE